MKLYEKLGKFGNISKTVVCKIISQKLMKVSKKFQTVKQMNGLTDFCIERFCDCVLLALRLINS